MMKSFEQIFLVRHGHYTRHPEALSEKGVDQSRRAASLLESQGLGSAALLLTSDAPRALQTAGIIAERLDNKAIESHWLNTVGNTPYGIKTMDEVVQGALDEAGLVAQEDSALIIVAHEPLLECATGGRPVANGQVVRYDEAEWKSPFTPRR